MALSRGDVPKAGRMALEPDAGSLIGLKGGDVSNPPIRRR
jgi:hypothetical protein